MERTLIAQLDKHVGKKVQVDGVIDVRRDHGKLVFVVVRDRSGFVQAVVHVSAADAFEAMQQVRPQSPVRIHGTVQERPEKMRKDEPNGNIELSIESLEVLSVAHELPFDLDAELNLDTLLDYRPLTLRTQRGRFIGANAPTAGPAKRTQGQLPAKSKAHSVSVEER
jgi:aspartyl-tRNA synthetase